MTKLQTGAASQAAATEAGSRPWVVKIGGRLCEEPLVRARLAAACAALGFPLVIVHGGGTAVSTLQKAFGVDPQFREGRRITDDQALDLVEMVLSGKVNKTMVRALQAAGLQAVGVSGCDGGMVQCDLVPGLGAVGVPTGVVPDLLAGLLDAGFIPVLSPVSLGPDGQPVNVNADELACAVAAALGAKRLLLLSDVAGVQVMGEIRAALSSDDVETLITAGEVTSGMVPKLRAAAQALASGVAEVRIAGFDGGSLAEVGGTALLAAPSVSPGVPDPAGESELLAGFFVYPRLVLTRGRGTTVWDEQGRSYLDFTAGLGVAALGHGRADLAAVLHRQFVTLGHVSNLYGNRPSLELAQRLKDASFAARVWFANSGTEANEAALKIARLHGRKAGGQSKHAIVAFKGGFHGRTLGALAVTHEPAYREPFAPLFSGIRFADFNDPASVEAVMDDAVCAVIVEPVQGEGGVVPPAPGFLETLRVLCDRHNALLIFDEVQCGLGRVGQLFAYQAFGTVPDVMCLAKPLAAGLPLGAVLVNQAVADLLQPGQHGSTFAGGPAACAVAVKVFDTIAQPSFLAQVQLLGKHLRAGLQQILADSPCFNGARGLGLMQALVVTDPVLYPPATIVQHAREQGLLITRAGKDAIRLLPPLNCRSAEIDEAVGILERVARAEIVS